jgi:uncharacterized membrane protein
VINKFLNDPLGNSLAVFVLVVLIVSWVLSLVLVLRDKPVPTKKSWFTVLLPVFAIPVLPAVLDLLLTRGIALLFAVVALAGLALAVMMPLMVLFSKSNPGSTVEWNRWIIPVLVIAGIAVAGYLTYVEVSGIIPQCGNLSGCSDVQNSKYSQLFGFLPVGILGLLGYFGILAAWLIWQYGPNNLNKVSALAIWGMCLFGVLFSAYLTFLEPFVIGATCMWCITSAVLMILLLLASTPAAQTAMAISDDDY